MSEFSPRAAHRTPTTFSSDINTPFHDVGMADWSDYQFREFFKGKRVLDIGSGHEGIARRLYAIFGEAPEAPVVINVNPQFSDWYMKDDFVNSVFQSYRRSKQDDLKAAIKETMELEAEDVEGYFKGRLAIAALVQQLPIATNSIDIALSTWGFPRCLLDCGGTDRDFEAGFSEIHRVLSSDGVALLGPIGAKETGYVKQRLQTAGIDSGYRLYPNGTHWVYDPQVLEILGM